jgi:hypothetical protein
MKFGLIAALEGTARVDNDNHFASFFLKKWLQTIIVILRKTKF